MTKDKPKYFENLLMQIDLDCEHDKDGPGTYPILDLNGKIKNHIVADQIADINLFSLSLRNRNLMLGHKETNCSKCGKPNI